MVNVVPAPGCDCTSIVPPAFLHDALADREAEAGALRLRREERDEEVAQHLRRDARARCRARSTSTSSASSTSERRDGGGAPSYEGIRARGERRTEVDTVILPCPSIAWIAFCIRFISTCRNFSGSIRVRGSGSLSVEVHVDGAVGDLAREDLHGASNRGVHVEGIGLPACGRA